MFESIRLQNYRSYTDASFEFGSGVNIVVGPNASGKTNLLEAVLVVARGGSYRVKDFELIQFDKPWARLDVETEENQSRVVKLEWLENAASHQTVRGGVKKSFEINGQVFLRLSQQKSVPVVLFEPNHLLLLTGSPEQRRNFLDDIIEQTTPGFGSYRRAYRRVLAQRNALLKKGYQIAVPQMFVWNLRLSELGGRIATERVKLVEQINGLATETYRDLSGSKAEIELVYQSSNPVAHYETTLLRKLESSIERDCLIGFTTAGPHRDDLQIILNGQPSQTTASRGETRSLILMLKIIELQLLASARGQTPLLLLDDVFSELDGKRRHALTDHLKNYQTFITTTDADVVVKHFTESCNVIPLG
jgi:DNA replication and repair protein RecF